MAIPGPDVQGPLRDLKTLRHPENYFFIMPWPAGHIVMIQIRSIDGSILIDLLQDGPEDLAQHEKPDGQGYPDSQNILPGRTIDQGHRWLSWLQGPHDPQALARPGRYH